MKVQLKKEPTDFKPVVLEIIFETAEELVLMDDMFAWNVSIPEIVYENDMVKQSKLLKLMEAIHDQVIQANKKVSE